MHVTHYLDGTWNVPAGSLTLNSGASLRAGAVIARDLTVNAGATLTARTGG
jgi:hypothetical protein